MAPIALFHGMTKAMCSTVPQHRSGITVSLNENKKSNSNAVNRGSTPNVQLRMSDKQERMAATTTI